MDCWNINFECRRKRTFYRNSTNFCDLIKVNDCFAEKITTTSSRCLIKKVGLVEAVGVVVRLKS